MFMSRTLSEISTPNGALGSISILGPKISSGRTMSKFLRHFSKPFQVIINPLSVQYFGSGATSRTLKDSQTCCNVFLIRLLHPTPPDKTRVLESLPQRSFRSEKTKPCCNRRPSCFAIANSMLKIEKILQ
jgi:hypothetical protein